MDSNEGIKSKHFGCFWKCMFLASMCYPLDIKKCKNPKKTIHAYKTYYDSFKYVLPCKFCRDFVKDVLEPKYPLDFSGREQLFASLYIWKDMVNKKLTIQGVADKKSPPLEVIKRKYIKYRATSCSSGKTCI